MRLTCPNCGAIYEIDAKLIPATGRDVQCASCGHVWIQTRRAPEAEAGSGTAAEPESAATVAGAATEAPAADEEAATRTDASAGEGVSADTTIHEGKSAPHGADSIAPDPAAGSDETVAQGDRAAEPVAADARTDAGADSADRDVPRRRPDDETLRILREEAAHAAAQRKARTAGGDPSPSHAAPPEAPPPEPATDRRGGPILARPDRDEARRPSTATPEPDPASSTEQATSRDASFEAAHRPAGEGSGELLPDIDEINSSLSGPERRPAPAARPVPEPGRGWAAGAALGLGALGLLILIYLATPWIADRIPALEAPLASYAAAIDRLRGWVGG